MKLTNFRSTDKQKYLNIVRYGVLNSMHADVRRIAPQNLVNDTPLSPTNDQLTRTLLDEQQHLQAKVDSLSMAKNTNNTVLCDELKHYQNRLAKVNEALVKMGLNQSNLQTSGIDNVMKNARVVCSTLSSAINLKQYVS